MRSAAASGTARTRFSVLAIAGREFIRGCCRRGIPNRVEIPVLFRKVHQPAEAGLAYELRVSTRCAATRSSAFVAALQSASAGLVYELRVSTRRLRRAQARSRLP